MPACIPYQYDCIPGTIKKGSELPKRKLGRPTSRPTINRHTHFFGRMAVSERVEHVHCSCCCLIISINYARKTCASRARSIYSIRIHSRWTELQIRRPDFVKLCFRFGFRACSVECLHGGGRGWQYNSNSHERLMVKTD